MTKLWIATGEASGDRLAAGLVERLQQHFPALEVRGIPGPGLRALGVEGAFPAEDLSVVGLWPAMKRLPRLLRRLNQAMNDVRSFRPDLIVTVDSPGFMRPLAARCLGVRRLHWVAPQVWAWNPERTRTFADSFDGLLCLFPFEPAWFAGTGIRCAWGGHPLVEKVVPLPQPTGPRTFALLPGSRPSEIDRHWPLLQRVVGHMQRRDPQVQWVVSVAPTVDRRQLRGVKATFVEGLAIPPVHAAAVALGTATLELAALGIPMVAFYSTDAITERWARYRLPRGASLSLPNRILGRHLVPELVESPDPQVLADALRAVANGEGKKQRRELAGVALSLGEGAWERTLDEVAGWLEGRHGRTQR